MKKTLSFLLALLSALTLCSAAAYTGESERLPAFTRAWGTIGEITESDGITSVLIHNGQDDALDIVLHLDENTPIVDDVTGKPLTTADLKKGADVYAWHLPYMTMSLPPQSTAVALVTNIPADHGAGQLVELCYANLLNEKELSVTFERETDALYLLTDEYSITRFGTDEAISLSELHPGSRLIFWQDEKRMVLLDGPYDSFVETSGETVSVNGKKLSAKAIEKEEALYIPLTAVVRELGYTVYRNAARTRYTVRKDGKLLLTIPVGSETLTNAEGETVYSLPAFVENNRLYVPLSLLSTLDASIWF